MRGLKFQLEFQRKRCTVSSEIRTLFQFKVRKYVKVDRHFFLYQLKKISGLETNGENRINYEVMVLVQFCHF